MAKQQKIRARERRIELLLVLGYTCKKCGAEDNLEFDCIIPQGGAHHKYDTSHRMCFYWREYRKGNLQILCSKCHNKKNSTEQYSMEIDDNPF